MKLKSTSRLAFPLASAIAALLASSSVHAANIWDGGASGAWNTGTNWDDNIVPAANAVLTFTGNVQNSTNNDTTTDRQYNGFLFTNDGSSGKTNAFTLSGNRITLGGNITTTASSSAITDTISLAMILNADRTITTNTNHNLTVSGIISQTGGARRLTKDGAGILTLSGANSYSGGTTINAGTLNVANVSGLGASGSTVSLGSATTLQLSTDTAFGGANPVYNLQMTNGGSYTSTIELNRATAGASTAITHNFGQLYISLNGGGAATLNVTAGANAAGALDTVAFTSMNAGNNNTVTETLNPTGGNITIGALTAAGNQLVTMALSGTTAGNAITGVIGGTGNQQLVAISKTGTSTWTLSNSGNNYTGGTTFSAGTLVFSNGALGTTGAITASGGTLQWASGNTQDISSRLAMTAATSTFDTNGNNVTFASAIGSSVAAALTKTGAGTLTLQGTNTYSGSTTVNMGTLSLDYGTNDTTKLSNSNALALGGGTLNLAGGTHTEVVSATTLTANTGSYVTRSSGSSVLQMNGITNNTGTVNFGAENIATTDNLNSGTTGIIGTWATVGGDWAINSGSTTSGGATVPGTGIADGFIRAYTAYTDVQRLTPGVIPNTSTANVRLIEGSGSAGNITLAAATTSINTLNQSISGGTGVATVALAGQILRADGILMGPTAGALTLGASVGSGTLTPTTPGGSIIVTNNSSNLLTINSVIADNGANSKLVKTGTGTVVLTGLNTYTGGTVLQDGTLRVGATQTAGFNGILGAQFNNGLIIANKSTAVFDLNNFNAVIKDLQGGGSLGGNVTLGSGTLQIRNPLNAGNPYAGIISGTGNLIVGDTTAWVTTSAHTYTGTTTAFSGAYYASILADGGIASGIGQSSSAAGNLIISNGTLSYNGTTAASTNRQFTLTGNGGFGVQNTGSIIWTSTAAITHSNIAAKTLNFSGSNTGTGIMAAGITDSGTGANITGITKSGTGNWALTGTGSTFTGAITLTGTTGSVGTLAYASAGGANPITFSGITTGSATLSYTGAAKTMSGAITASALTTGTITLDASGTGAVNYSNTGSLGSAASGNKNLILSGTNTGNNILAGGWNNNTGGAATLTKNGVSTWVLTNANSYSGGTTISAGVLAVGVNLGGVGGDSISPDGTSTSLGSGTVNVAAGAALHINTAGLTIANNITLNGLSYGVNSGGPAATNAGPWNGALMGASKTGVVSNTFSGTITLNATSNVSTNWSDKTMIITGKVTGAGGLTFDNSAPTARQGGLFRLSNTTNDYGGNTTINNGNTVGAQPTLILGASNVIPDGGGKGNVNVLGNLNLNSFSDTINGLSGTGLINNGVALTTSTLTVGNNNATGFTYSGIIQNGIGTVALVKTGSGTQTLSGTTNSYSGGTTISAGTLQADHSSALGTGSVSVAAGAALLVGVNGVTLANNITLNGTTANGAINNGHLSAGNTTNLTGTLTLNATSNITTNWNDKTLRLSGKITGAGGLNFDLRSGSVGGRFLVTGATNDYSGATSVTGTPTPAFGFTGQAMLYLGATNALPTTTALTLNYADLYLNGQSQTLPSISGSGSFSVQNGSTTAATLTLGSGNTTSTFSGTIKDNGLSVTNTASTSPTPPASIVGTVALTKTGNGTLTLTNTHTYTGATNVNAGKLLIDGSTSSTSLVTVASGATLGGSGTIGGTVTIQAGGTFSPGNSIESIATGNLSLLANATFAQEIDKSVAANISGDLTATTGSLSITSGAILTLTELGTSGAWDLGDTITLIGYSTGTWNGGLFTYLGNTLNDDSTFTFSGIDWIFNYNDLTAGDNYNSDLSAFTGSARYVTMTAVPEPRAALIGGLGLLMLMRRRRTK